MKKKRLIIAGVLLVILVLVILFHKTRIWEAPDGGLVVEKWPGEHVSYVVYEDHVMAYYYVDKGVDKMIIPDTFWGKPLTIINDYFCSGEDDPLEIEIGANVEVIGAGAFTMYERLVNVTGGEKVREIRKGAFYGCDALEEVILGDRVEVIEKEAFFGCNNLTNVHTTDSLRYIGEEAFYGSGLTEIYLPESVVVEEGAFDETGIEYMDY